MRATKNQLRQRIEETLQIILSGGDIGSLRRYAQEKGWNLSDGQLHRYQAKAWDLIAERAEKKHDRIFHRALLQRRLLLARALEAGDLRTALAIAKDECDLLGIYPPRKIAPTTPDGTAPYAPDGLSDADRLSRVAQIINAAIARRALPGGARGAGESDGQCAADGDQTGRGEGNDVPVRADADPDDRGREGQPGGSGDAEAGDAG